MYLNKFCLLAAASLILVSCKDDDKPEYITLGDYETTELLFESVGDEKEVCFTASLGWTAVKDNDSEGNVPEWFDVFPPQGEPGSCAVTVMVLPNEGMDTRQGSFRLVCSGQEVPVTVTQTGIAEDAYVYFDDENFKSYILSQYDTNGDGKLAKEEAAKIVRLEFSDTEIKSIKGVESMKSLEYLDCSYNKIEGNLDLSGLENLKVANTHHNVYSSLDVSGCTSLETLIANDNFTFDESGYMVFPMQGIDLSGCASLKQLDLTDNGIKSLDCGDCVALEDLNCRHNDISSLNIEGCTKLKRLSVRTNAGLSGTLDLSHCPDLEYLECYETGYQELNTSGCSVL
ncbi:MAG: BACON domain-containing protein, partial [Candidatus Cryptobacteroides sp.]